MNPTILHHSFDYAVPGEPDCGQEGFPNGSHSAPSLFEHTPSHAVQHASLLPAVPSVDHRAPVSASSIFRTAAHGSMTQSSVQPLPLQGPAGFEFRSSSSSSSSGQDPHYAAATELSLSPLPSSRDSSSASPNSVTSNYGLISHNASQYGLNQNASYNLVSHPNASATGLYASSSGYPQGLLQSSLELRSRLNPMPTTSSMQPPSRYSSHPIPASPPPGGSIRNDYTVAGPHAPRQGFPTQNGIYQLSPTHSPMSIMPRSLDSSLGHESPSAPGFFGAPHDAALPNSGQQAPPFENTKPFFVFSDRNGHTVQVEITAKIERGFFKVDDQWVCYRRNYFTVLCTFDILPSSTAQEPICLHKSGNQRSQIHSFALTISAKADGEDGKSIDLVQHTPKRDKGPMTAPDRKEVKPNPGGNLNTGFPASAVAYTGLGHAHDYEGSSPPAMDSQTVASFERMQFKKATANNGKRRAAQQYFYLIVELHGKIRNGQGHEEWVKIAHRVSSRMVVRGRSPGHYKEDRRSSAQPGGGSGQMGYDGGHGHFGGGPMDASLAPPQNSGGYHRSGGYPGNHSAMNRTAYMTGGPLAPLHAPLNGMPMRNFADEYMDVDNGASDGFYAAHEYNSLPSPPTPRVSQSLQQSSNNSPASMASTSFGYPTPLSMKEELRMAETNADEERTHLKGHCSGTPLPTHWSSHDLRGPLRDCRSLVQELR